MRSLTNSALERLRRVADSPDLEGTRYRLIAKLGQGGMGGVFRVQDQVLERELALKVITVPDPEGVLAARLLQEARVIARLEHPGIVPVHDTGTLGDGRPYYTMKLVQGKRLDEHIHGLTSRADRLRLFLRICDAVAFAHAQGVLHRDLKPGNIMVGPFGEVLVMDWGLAKVLRSAEPGPGTPAGDSSMMSATNHGSVLGTPGFMAPEQMRGDQPPDARADVYSLGAILQCLLEGASPQPLPRALAAICRQALAEDPAGRYASAQELSSDVGHFLDGLAVAAYREGPLGPAWRWTVRNRTWILLLLAYMLTRGLLILFRPR